MKQPSVSRFRKKTTSKLKLVCSFNGEFHVRPPSNKLRYIGGETRIVSVDQNISFSKLRLKISDICPNIRSFTLRYQLRLTACSYKDAEADDEMPLILIASDDDVKCMVDEYDKLELYGKHARLWFFVCSEIECGSNNGRAEKGGNEDLLRKMVLKRRLLAKQTKRDYEHQFMDSHLGPQTKFSTLQSVPYGEKIFLFSGMGNGLLHPLNPRDGNLRAETNGPMKLTVGLSSSGMCNGGGGKTWKTGQSSLPSKEVYDCGVVSIRNGFGGKHFNTKGQVLTANFDRENIMPWAVNCGSVKTHLPSNCSNQHVRSIYPGESSYFGDRVSGSCQNGIQNHRFGMRDSRNHRIYPYCMRNHRKNFVEAKNYIGVRLDSTGGTCYLGIKPYSNIPEQRLSMGLNDPSLLKLWPGFAEHAPEGRLSMMASCLNKGISPFDIQYGKATFRKQGGPAVLQDGNSNTVESHLAYHDFCNGATNQSFLSSDAVKSPSSCVRVTEPREDLLSGSEFENNEALLHDHENFHGMSTNYASKCSDLETEKLLVGSPENANISDLSNKMDHRNEAATGCSLTNGTKNFEGGVASSMDLMYNLSLSSSKEIDTPRDSSVSGSVVSDTFLKSQSKPLDPVDEGLSCADSVVDESNRVRSSSSLENAAKARRVDVHGEEVQKDPGLCPEGKGDTKTSYKYPKIIDGISSHLTAFLTHFAAGELQTIKNTDLEYIKELGSGTFGTVFYGKWRGSDVAIKRMKPSCFTRDPLEEDRLVADFWREAHMLGQLHHPNIVALYGVVTDGPPTNLATVTEYMVNGSLRQVLQRKDRTIDRRKRLIIAMDAAFGMEYLHEKNIVHFDLKSHNFLVNMRDPQRPVCKIGDLGLSKIKEKTLISGGVRGTIPWMAPELLNNKNNLVTEKIDVFSFGVVMWELLTGEEPYANLHSEEIIAGIIKGTLRPEIPNWCDPSWRSLMERCWSSGPDSRPAFSEISKELLAMAVSMNIK